MSVVNVCRAVGAVVVVSSAGAAFGQNVLRNAGFEAAPILGDGQSDIGPNGAKWTTRDPSNGSYSWSVSGLEDWSYAMDGGAGGVHTDVGPTRWNALEGERAVFSNRWGRIVHQTAGVVGDGMTYEASIAVGSFGPRKAGSLRLIAGGIDADNRLMPGSLVLGEVTFGTADWTRFTPDLLLNDGGWTRAAVSFAAGTQHASAGMPLVFAFEIADGCVGSLQFDDASLTAVPAPGAVGLALAAGVLGSRRRRS